MVSRKTPSTYSEVALSLAPVDHVPGVLKFSSSTTVSAPRPTPGGSTPLGTGVGRTLVEVGRGVGLVLGVPVAVMLERALVRGVALAPAMPVGMADPPPSS